MAPPTDGPADAPTDSPASSPVIHRARWSEMSPDLLHRILALRVNVFVVEQECAYPELDGRDNETGTLHVWATPDKAAGPAGAGSRAGAGDHLQILGYLRLLTEPDGECRIGRVCVDPSARGAGIAARLMRFGLDCAGEHPVVLDAQSYLRRWYERLGFTVTGPEFLDDGILHLPMRRARRHAGSRPAHSGHT